MTIYENITAFCIRKGYVSEEDRELYGYGFDIIFYTIWSTAVLLLVGLVLKRFLATLIIVSVFYTFQSSGGGYHANSHLKCFLFMLAGLLTGLSFFYLNNLPGVLWSLLGLGALVLVFFPLVLHPNKSHLETERKRLTIRSVVTTISLLLVAVVLSFWKPVLFRNELLDAFSAAFFLSGISRIIGKFVYRNNHTI